MLIVLYSIFRPMYVDSTYNDPPAGDIPVAKELRTHIEPLLMVSYMYMYTCTHSGIDFSGY